MQGDCILYVLPVFEDSFIVLRDRTWLVPSCLHTGDIAYREWKRKQGEMGHALPYTTWRRLGTSRSVQREGRLARAAEIKLSYGNTLSRWSVEQWKLCGRWRDVKAGLLTSGPYNPGCSPFFTCLIIGTHHLPGGLEFRRGNTKNTKRFKLLNVKMCRTK